MRIRSTSFPVFHSFRGFRWFGRSVVMASVIGVIGLTIVTSGTVIAQESRLHVAPQVRPQALNMQYHRAKTAFDSGASLLEAKARVDIVLAELPDDTEALKLRAAILMAMNHAGLAYSDALHARTLTPDDGEVHVLLCESGVATENRPDARRSLDAATDLIMGDAAMYIRLSACALELGEIPPAEALARLAMASGERDGRGYLQLARVFVQTDRPGNAATVLLQGLEERKVRTWDIRRDTVLAPLMDREDLAAWRRR